MEQGLFVPGVTPELLLANFRQFNNNPSASLDDMYAYQNAQQQRARVSVPLTVGKGPWVFPRAFANGVVPVVQLTVETPDIASYTLDAKVVKDSITNTGCMIQVNRISASQTLGGTLAALVGAVIQVFSPEAGTVTVNCTAATATS